MATCSADTGRRLLLLARYFPFNHGEVAAESYLETEIGLLAPRFDEVVVVGTEATVGSEPTCALPGNVKAVALGVGNSSADKISESVQGVWLGAFGPSFVRKAISYEDAADTGRKRVFLGYFVARAYRKYQAIVGTLESLGFEPSHLYSFWFWDTALVVAWIKTLYPCALAFTRAHGYDLYEYRSYLCFLPLRRYLLQRLDYVLPCSHDGRGYINRRWLGFEDKVRTAYLGTRDLPDRSAIPTNDALRVVSCSRVVPVKRVLLIARALALLDIQGASIEWTHFGDGDDLAEVKSLAAGYKTVRAEFPGNVPNAELLDEYGRRDFDLFVNASESEGLPISLMEACGVGIPVLATDVGGTSEIVQPGMNGQLVSKDVDAGALAAKIGAFAELSTGERLYLRRGARRVWEEHFQASKNVEELAELLLGGEDR